MPGRSASRTRRRGPTRTLPTSATSSGSWSSRVGGPTRRSPSWPPASTGCRSVARRSGSPTSKRSISVTPWRTPSRRLSAASSAASRPASPVARWPSTSLASSATCCSATSTRAIDTIYESSIFPSICGRVCPQESQCESQCVIGSRRWSRWRSAGSSATSATTRAPPKAEPPPFAGQLGKVAIVGSGSWRLWARPPTWRATARRHRLRGAARGRRRAPYGIPASVCPAISSGARCSGLRDAGVKFETNKVIGKTFTIPQLSAKRATMRCSSAAGAGAPIVPRHPRASSPAGSTRPTSS